MRKVWSYCLKFEGTWHCIKVYFHLGLAGCSVSYSTFKNVEKDRSVEEFKFKIGM